MAGSNQMIEPIREFEGTWEEIEEKARAFAGHRLRLIVLPGGADEPAEGEPDTQQPTPIEELLQERGRRVPESEWDKLPPDLTDHLDHYIYGTPKE
jgi:hypothetical protein